MNSKQITGIVVALIGAAMIIFAVHSMKRIGMAKGIVNVVTTPFSGNPIGQETGRSLKEKAGQYDTPVKVCLYGGIILVILGGGAVLLFRKKS